MSVEKLLLLKKQYDKQIYHLQDMVTTTYPKRKERLLKDVEEVSADLICIKQYPSDTFAIQIKGNLYQERSKAADMLFQTSCSMAPRYNEFVDIGQIKGLDMLLTTTGEGKTILLQGKHRYSIVLGESAIGNIKRIENKVDDIAEIYKSLNEQLDELDANIGEAEKQIVIPFQQQDELQTKQQQLIAITAEINVTAGVVQEETTEGIIVPEPPTMEM